MPIVTKSLTAQNKTVESPVDGMGRISHAAMYVGGKCTGTYIIEVNGQDDNATADAPANNAQPTEEWIQLQDLTYQDGTGVTQIVAVADGNPKYARAEIHGARRVRIRKTDGAADASGATVSLIYNQHGIN